MDESEEPCGADPTPIPNIENLVFRGGGVKGMAYCGALKVLSDFNLLNNVKRYAGSSAGAITAALLSIGYTIHELEDLFKNMDMEEFRDKNGNFVAKAERLYKKFALYEGQYLNSWITSCIEKKTNANITFKQVLEKFGKEIVIVGACVSHMEVVYFNYKEFPDMSIREAIRISMSIPILFEPIRIDDHLYVDGGLADNFPLHVFDSFNNNSNNNENDNDIKNSRHAHSNMQTLGLFLKDNKTRHEVARDINKMQDFIGCLLDTVKTRIAHLGLKPGDAERTLFIQTHHISATQFDISKEEKELLYDEGAKAARAYASKFIISDYVKSPTWGRLIVKLKSGGGFQMHPLALNLHCALTLGTICKKTSTKRRHKSNPKWEENFIFQVNDQDDVLKVEVFEGVLLGSRLIGQSITPVIQYIDHHCFETKIDIGKGIINLEVTLSTY